MDNNKDIKQQIFESDLDDMKHENEQFLASDIKSANDMIQMNEMMQNEMELFDRAGEIDPSQPQANNNNNNANGNGNGNGDNMSRIPFDMRSEFGGVATESIPDVNIYQHKKTVAQGMMDIALFSANANQLRYVLESENHPYYYPGIVLITISLIFQVAVGCGLLLNTRYNVKDKKEICIANKVNNFTVVGIFLVTVINVFISAFGVAAGGTAIPVVGVRTDLEDTPT